MNKQSIIAEIQKEKSLLDSQDVETLFRDSANVERLVFETDEEDELVEKLTSLKDSRALLIDCRSVSESVLLLHERVIETLAGTNVISYFTVVEKPESEKKYWVRVFVER